jgi:succinyl-CoA synthetase beta subunit
MRLKIAPVLAGFRQRPGVDFDAAVQAILAIARYALSHAGQLVELEVNPLLLHTQGCTAVDALITLDSQCNESEQQHE